MSMSLIGSYIALFLGLAVFLFLARLLFHTLTLRIDPYHKQQAELGRSVPGSPYWKQSMVYDNRRKAIILTSKLSDWGLDKVLGL